MFVGEVRFFREVVFEVVEFDTLGVVAEDKFPVSFADDGRGAGIGVAVVVREVPIECFAIDGLFAAEGDEAEAVEVLIGLEGVAEGFEDGGVDVVTVDGSGVFSWFDAGALEEEGDPDTAFVVAPFVSSERSVVGGLGVAAIVGGENDEGFFVDSFLFQGGDNPADTVVDALNHACVDVAVFGKVGSLLSILFDLIFLGLKGGVDAVVAHIEHEGFLFLFDESDGFVSENVGKEVALFATGVGLPSRFFSGGGNGPLAFEGVEVVAGVSVVAAGYIFMKALMAGIVERFAAEVPFSDKAVFHASSFEAFGEGDFFEGKGAKEAAFVEFVFGGVPSSGGKPVGH